MKKPLYYLQILVAPDKWHTLLWATTPERIDKHKRQLTKVMDSRKLRTTQLP